MHVDRSSVCYDGPHLLDEVMHTEGALRVKGSTQDSKHLGPVALLKGLRARIQSCSQYLFQANS
jgi:hypothetical protein